MKTTTLNPTGNELLADLLHRLLQKAGQPEEARALLCEELRKITGARLAAVLHRSDNTTAWYPDFVTPVKYSTAVSNWDTAFFERVAQAGETNLWQLDHPEDLIRQELLRQKAKNALVIPLSSPPPSAAFILILDSKLPENSASLRHAISDLASVLGLILQQVSPEPVFNKSLSPPEISMEKELLQQITAASPVGIVTVNTEGEINYANQRAEAILGLSRGEIQQRHYNAPEWRITTLDGSPFPAENLPFTRVQAEQKPVFDIRHAIIWPDGRRVILSINAAPLYGSAKEFAGMVSIIEDITERCLLDQHLIESEARFRELIENAPLPVVISRHGAILYANSKCNQALGLEDSEPLLGESLLDWIVPTERTAIMERITQREAGTDLTTSHETTGLRKDGSTFPMRYSVSQVQLSDGPALLAFLEDVTDQKQAEAELRENEQRYRMISENSAVGIVWGAPGGKIESTNTTFARMLGYAPEELAGKTIFEFTYAEDKPLESEIVRKLTRGEVQVARFEKRFLSKTGGLFWAEISVSCSRNPDNSIRSYIGIVQDITEQKQAVDELQASETKFRRFLDTAIEGVWIVDEKARTIFANNRLAELLGYPLEEIMAKSYPDFLFPEDLADYEANASKRRQGVSQRHERRFLRQDGSTLWTIVASVPTMDANGIFRGSFAMITDISELKQSEAALRESELRFRSLFEQAAIGVAQVETDTGRYLRVNKRYCEIVGYTDTELAKLDFQKITHPDDLDADLANMKRLVGGETREFTIEKRYRRKDKQTIWAQLTVTPMWEPGAKPDSHIAVVEDITGRKEAETALEESRRRLTMLIANLPGIVYRCRNDRDWSMEFISDGCQDLTGYSAKDFVLDQLINYNDLILAEDGPLVKKVIQQSLKEQTAYELSYRIRTSQGRLRWVWERGAGVYDDKGKVVALEGFIADISDRQQAESALRESEERYRGLFEQSVVGLVIFAPDGRIVAANAALEGLTGFSEMELKALGTRAFFHRPQDRPALLAELKNKSQLKNFETTLRRKDGTTFDASLNVAQIHLGNDSYLQVSCQDISERKQAEDEIHKLNAELDQRVQLRTAELNAANRELESFAYAVSHDLRAPLRGIDGWSQALLEDYQEKLDEQGREYLHTVRAEAQRMGRLIDALLSLSRINRSEMKRQPLDLSEMVREITTDLQRREPERKVKLHITPHLKTEADPDLLLVLLRNLIGNAWKFTSRREQAVITFGMEKRDEGAVYFVQDNGAGFDMQFATKIFTPFQRLHHQEEYPGTGIGLATVQRIIHRHGGRIWTEARLDEGATFFFTLPDMTEDDHATTRHSAD